MNTMRTRDGFRRIDSTWPQTQVMKRRAPRTRDNPYRRRPQRTAQGYTVVVLIAAVVTALAYVVRELILVWP